MRSGNKGTFLPAETLVSQQPSSVN